MIRKKEKRIEDIYYYNWCFNKSLCLINDFKDFDEELFNFRVIKNFIVVIIFDSIYLIVFGYYSIDVILYLYVICFV